MVTEKVWRGAECSLTEVRHWVCEFFSEDGLLLNHLIENGLREGATQSRLLLKYGDEAGPIDIRLAYRVGLSSEVLLKELVG